MTPNPRNMNLDFSFRIIQRLARDEYKSNFEVTYTNSVSNSNVDTTKQEV